MYFGRVVGSVWATIKSPQMVGQRMLVVQPLTPELKNTGKPLICTDGIGAGTGELVYWVRGKEASFPFLPMEPPIDTAVIGIVDEVHVRRTVAEEPPVISAPIPASTPSPSKTSPAASAAPRKNSRKNGPC